MSRLIVRWKLSTNPSCGSNNTNNRLARPMKTAKSAAYRLAEALELSCRARNSRRTSAGVFWSVAAGERGRCIRCGRPSTTWPASRRCTHAPIHEPADDTAGLERERELDVPIVVMIVRA